MTTFTNGSTNVFELKQLVVLYNSGNLQQNEFINRAVFAKSTNSLPYQTGVLLAKYGANAPAGKAGLYVNYDPDSANLDQKVCVGVISQEMLLPIYGADVTADGSDFIVSDAKFNSANFLPFAIGNGMFYENAITKANSTAVVTGWRDTFELQVMAQVEANGSMTNVLSIQGLK